MQLQFHAVVRRSGLQALKDGVVVLRESVALAIASYAGVRGCVGRGKGGGSGIAKAPSLRMPVQLAF